MKTLLLFALLLAISGVAMAANVEAGSTAARFFTAQDTAGATDNLRLGAITSQHTAAVIVTGTPTSCTYRLEGSLDGINWFDVSGAQTCTSNVMFHVVNKPLRWVRGYLISIGGGSTPTAALQYAGAR